MSRKEEKWIKRLEILGASAAVIVIVSAVGTFLLDCHAADGTGCRMRKHSQCGIYGALLL